MPKLTDEEWEKVLAELYGEEEDDAPRLNVLPLVIAILVVWLAIFAAVKWSAP